MELFNLAAPYLAVYVIDTLNVFLHSTDPEPQPEHVRAAPRTPEVTRHRILTVARKLWRRMQDPGDEAIPMTHDGYLKLWALQSPPIVGYDAIFLDEAQDTNPVTLEIVLKPSRARDGGRGPGRRHPPEHLRLAARHRRDGTGRAVRHLAAAAHRVFPLRAGPGGGCQHSAEPAQKRSREADRVRSPPCEAHQLRRAGTHEMPP